jgi:hypothetical protein
MLIGFDGCIRLKPVVLMEYEEKDFGSMPQRLASQLVKVTVLLWVPSVSFLNQRRPGQQKRV